MATAFRNPILEEEPFEDSQGFRFPTARTISSSSSSDALNASQPDMESQGAPQQKLTRGKSPWARKSVKKSNNNTTATPSHAVQRVPSALHALPIPDVNSSQISLPADFGTSPQSIIPDVSIDNPLWEAKELEWTAISAAAFRAKHPVHNPIGPRNYKNHHIIPPHARRDNRPPSVFSPTFPPMAPSTHTRSQDSSHIPGSSRSPSGSPLPTPNSSQTGINEPLLKTRSRKTSQTAHDTVDLLDGSDPWGQQWHHQSPYDVGITRSSAEGQESSMSSVNPVAHNPQARPRRLSTTAGQNRRKVVAPSPLSQSASAVHLHTPEKDKVPMTRRLSKRRKTFRGLFGTHDVPDLQSPVDLSLAQPSDGNSQRKFPERNSTSSVPSTSFAPIQSTTLSSEASWQKEKKEKRGSLLGRLARTFTLTRKVESGKRSSQSFREVWKRNTYSEPKVNDGSQQVKQSSPEKSRESRRIPAPTIESEPRNSSSVEPLDNTAELGDGSSTFDLETPITLGRLTIANPDDPSSSVTTTPVYGVTPLPSVAEPRAKETGDLRLDDPPPVPSKAATPVHPMIPSEAAPPLETVTTTVQSQESRAPFVSTERAQSQPVPSPISGLAATALSYIASTKDVDDSPLSQASLFVNPPTPYIKSSNVVATPSRSVPELHISTESFEGPKIKTSSSGKVRETETFKLVRSPSDQTYSSGQTIIADGEEWQVIDASKNNSKRIASVSATPVSPTNKEQSKSQSKDKEEARSRREHTRHKKEQERSKVEIYQTREEPARHRPEGIHGKRESGKRHEEKKSRRGNSYHADGADRRLSRDDEYGHQKKESRRQETSRRESYSLRDGSDRRRHTPSTSSSSEPSRQADQVRSSRSRHASHTEAQMANVSFSKIPHGHERERRPSMSERPTSEVSPAAELNNVRAREAWEMERLWKGRSMSMGQEGSNFISTPVSSGNELDHLGHDELHRSNTVHGSGHGSSHTYFVVQTPYQNAGSSVPFSAPPPILYTNQSVPSIAFPTSSPYPHNSIPPPEPIRTTPYQFAPLPPSLASLDDPVSKEYWAKLAGVSTHH